jgi:hypothetical protein
MTIQDVKDNRVELSTIGLDDQMVLEMADAEIDAYCTTENFTAMFGGCDLTAADLAGWALAIRGQQFLLRNLDLLQ